MTGRRIGAGIAAIAAMLLAVGCGSDDPGPVPSSSSTGSSTAESSTAESSTAESSTGRADTSVSQAPTLPPPYIDGADWVDTEVGPSLQIRPTRNGRDVSGDGADDEAWREVLKLHPDADSPGMRAQFDCHWTFARLVDPEKPSWNLEPERPVVTESEMISARCNPGFAEEE